jgi:histidine triad (HIT) family protein
VTVSDCLFCKIASGEIPATVVARDEKFVAFRDINPEAPTHVLAIPQAHVESLSQTADVDLLGGLLLFARRVAEAEGLAERGYRIVVNTNADGGQTVFHLHAHVLGGRPMLWPPG